MNAIKEEAKGSEAFVTRAKGSSHRSCPDSRSPASRCEYKRREARPGGQRDWGVPPLRSPATLCVVPKASDTGYGLCLGNDTTTADKTALNVTSREQRQRRHDDGPVEASEPRAVRSHQHFLFISNDTITLSSFYFFLMYHLVPYKYCN